MNISCQEYENQIGKAQETVKLLEERILVLRSKLDKKPDDATYKHELKQLTLDMKITMNELEHAQSELQACLVNTEKKLAKSK